jgi:hypothetical protein
MGMAPETTGHVCDANTRQTEAATDAIDGRPCVPELARRAPVSGNGPKTEYSGLPDDIDEHVRIERNAAVFGGE